MQCHIVPRFMLAGFADPDTDRVTKKRLWKYRFDIGKWRGTSPRSVASVLDYYVVKDSSGNRDERLERDVIRPIEDGMAKLLKSGRFEPGAGLSDADRTTIATFVALMSLRTRLGHQEIARIAAEVSETALLMACTMMAEPEASKVRKLLKTHRLRVAPTMPMVISLSLLRDATHRLNQMGWSLVIPGSGDYFVVSDDPYRQVNPDENPPSAQGALGARNVEVSLPLTRDLAFFAGWHTRGTRWVQAPPVFVEEINRRTCMTALVIAAPKRTVAGFDQILKDWEVRKPHMKDLRLLA